MRKAITPEDIDQHLPQTQCGLCGYGGCMPYAEALVNGNAAINLCLPGGIPTLNKLGQLLEQDPTPFVASMAQKAKPPTVAAIREAECIGCTKCIQACPVDAILGSAKQMHTVIAAECTGCELCVPACPVDCIDLLITPTIRTVNQAHHARMRFHARKKRLSKETSISSAIDASSQQKRDYIQAAIIRTRKKKTQPA
jgi:Na+-translocating ferredoxin:NAD+ oxidoreductase subunit B